MTASGPHGEQTQAFMSARTVRLLKWSVIVMTILIAAGLVALVYGMKIQMDKLAEKPPEAEVISFPLPPGAVLQSVSSAGEDDSLWLHLRTKEGRDELLLVNARGQLVRTVRLKQTP